MEAERLPSCPAVMFRNVAGSEFPMAANVLAHRPRLAWAFGTSEEGLVPEFKERIQRPVAPTVLTDGLPPYQENSLLNDAVDLRQLPVLTHFEQDGGPYVTAGLVVARDPRSGMSTVGFSPHATQGAAPAWREPPLPAAHVRVFPPRRGAGRVSGGGGVHRRAPAGFPGGVDVAAGGNREVRASRRPLGRAAGAGAMRDRGL